MSVSQGWTSQNARRTKSRADIIERFYHNSKLATIIEQRQKKSRTRREMPRTDAGVQLGNKKTKDDFVSRLL